MAIFTFNTGRNMLFSDLAREWIKIHSLSVSECTTYYLTQKLNRLDDTLGNFRIKNVTSNDIQNLFISFSNDGLSTASMKDYAKVVRPAFRYAVEKGYIKETPYENIIIPKTVKDEITPFEAEEVKKLLAVPAQEWFLDACAIAFCTGMRKGEVFGLKKDVINFNKNFLMVKHSQSLNAKGRVVLSATKTKASRRRIDCDEETMQILWHRCNTSDSPFIFSYDDGSMLIPWSLSDTLKRKSKAAGIKAHRFHDLRHGHATYLLINNVHPKIVQERLGHANVGITLDTYSHLIPGLQKTAVEALNKLQF